MKAQAFRARPKGKALPGDAVERSVHAIAPNVPDRQFTATAPNQAQGRAVGKALCVGTLPFSYGRAHVYGDRTGRGWYVRDNHPGGIPDGACETQRRKRMREARLFHVLASRREGPTQVR